MMDDFITDGADYEDDVDNDPDMPPDDDGLTDVEADAQTLASAGWGTDEDYGYFGDPYEYE